jgi:hypothetical protein
MNELDLFSIPAPIVAPKPETSPVEQFLEIEKEWTKAEANVAPREAKAPEPVAPRGWACIEPMTPEAPETHKTQPGLATGSVWHTWS